jgi:hypothetical protein
VDIDRMKFLARYGSKKHQDNVLDGKYGHPLMSATREIANSGHPEHVNRLIGDKNVAVRRAAARYAGPEHFDKMMHDEDSGVRGMVAAKGEHHHVDHLLNDPDEHVRTQAGWQKKALELRDRKKAGYYS